jgi:hypothetical protein
MYLTACSETTANINLLNHKNIGLMVNPKCRIRPEFFNKAHSIALDNGCFADNWNKDYWILWLRHMVQWKDRLLFTVAPDVVADAKATLELADKWLPYLNHIGYKPAFVGQDGQEDLELPWDEFETLFIGGSTEWKLSEVAFDLVYEARRRGKRTHMGRVNSHRRFKTARVNHYDSVDGTFIKFGPDINALKLFRWVDDKQGVLPL